MPGGCNRPGTHGGQHGTAVLLQMRAARVAAFPDIGGKFRETVRQIIKPEKVKMFKIQKRKSGSVGYVRARTEVGQREQLGVPRGVFSARNAETDPARHQ